MRPETQITIVVKIRATLPSVSCQVSPDIFVCGGLHSEIRSLPPSSWPPSFFFGHQRLLRSKVPGFWESLSLGLPEDKVQERERAVGSPEIMVSFFVTSFHAFLIACDEEIPLV